MPERSLRVTILGDERDLLRAFGRSTRATRTFEAQMTGVSRSLRNVFAAAGVSLGAIGIVRAIQSTVSAAIEFESSFAGVRKTVDATEPQLQALAESFRRLALEIPISVEEINRIGEAAGQLGIQQKGILDFTKTVAALGVTTNLSSEQAADALARLANITQTPQDQFDNLGSTIADLGNKLAATESEIVDFGVRIAAAGKIVGLTVEQTLAIAGAFSSVGVEAEAGGTAVSKVFISLANAVKTGGSDLEDFATTAGVSAAQFRKAFEEDAGGAFVSFVNGLKRIDDEGGNVFKTLKDLGLTDARLIRAFLSISQSGDLLNRSLSVGARAWEENSALQEEAAKRYETTASKLQIFQNRVNDLQITLGNVLAPALLKIVTPLGEWLEQTENQERVQRALTETMRNAGQVLEGVRAVVEPLAEAIKSLADRMGGLDQAVKLLLITMVAAKVVNFGTALTGLGTAAAGTTTKVRLLQGALLRLGAIGVIVISIEFLSNYNEIQAQFTDLLKKAKLISDPPVAGAGRLKFLQDQLKTVAQLYGLNSQEVHKLRAEIRALERELGQGSPTASSLHEERPTPGLRGDTASRTTDAIADAVTPIEAATDAKTEATKKAIEQGKRDNAALIAAEKREQDALRAQRRRAARISSQFEALGLTSTGEQRTPGVGALRSRLTSLRDQLKGTTLDTEKTREQLDRISQVLKGKFGAVGRDVRQAILQMFNDISAAMNQGQGDLQQGGPLTKTSGLNTKKILAGIGLSEEEIRELRGRLSGVNTAGFQLSQGTGASKGGLTRPRDSGLTIDNYVTVEIDGHKITSTVTKQQQKQRRRNPKQKRGPNRMQGGV